MSAVQLDASPGLTHLAHQFSSISNKPCLKIIASPLSTCSILARQTSVRCPIPTQPGHPAVRPYLSRMFCGNYSLFARLPLANSSFGWIVGPCGVVFAVYSTDCQHTSSRIANIMHFSPSRRLTQRVFIAPVGVNNRNSSVRSSLPTKLLASTSCSIWLHPVEHTSPNGTTSPVVFATKTTMRRCPRSFHLKMVHDPCRTIQPISTCLDPIPVLYFTETASRNVRSCP